MKMVRAFTFFVINILMLGGALAVDPPLDTTLKYIFTDKPSLLETTIKSGFVPAFEETPIPLVEQYTAFRITIQNHYKGDECVQRVRIYMDADRWGCFGCSAKKIISKDSKKEKNLVLRDDLLATCDGGYDIKRHTEVNPQPALEYIPILNILKATI